MDTRLIYLTWKARYIKDSLLCRWGNKALFADLSKAFLAFSLSKSIIFLNLLFLLLLRYLQVNVNFY